MTEKKKQQLPKPTMGNTKKEMLDAYNELLKELQEVRQEELKPEKKIEEKKTREILEVADSLSVEKVVKGIGSLKFDMSKMLTEISDKLESEVQKLQGIQKAIAIKEEELHELYEIEKSAATLAALIEVQNRKRQEYEFEMASKREDLVGEIESTREEWKKEKREYEQEVKEQRLAEEKKHEREKEEFLYNLKREQQLLKDEFEDEKAGLEKEIQLKREQMEKELAERERALRENERELNELRKNAVAFPKELDAAVAGAVKDVSDRIKADAANKEQLISKEFEGEKKVFITRIESLEKTVEAQAEQISRLSGQLEKSYQKVEDIAVKAIEGSSNLKSFSYVPQHMTAEQSKKQE